MASSNGKILVPNNGATPVATNTFTDSVTADVKHMQVSNLYDVSGNDAIGTNASGVSPSTGGAGMLGWLSTIAQKLSGTLNVVFGSLPAGTNNIGHVNVDNFPTTGPTQNSGGTGGYIQAADSSAAINVGNSGSGATATIVAGVTGKKIVVTHYNWISNGTGTVQLAYGATPTAITGAYPSTAESGVSAGTGIGALFTVPTGQDLKIVITGTSATAQGLISYYQA